MVWIRLQHAMRFNRQKPICFFNSINNGEVLDEREKAFYSTFIDPFWQKYFTRVPFSRIDKNETCFISSIQYLDNLDVYLYSDQQSSNFLTIEIQSNLNLRHWKWIVCSQIDRMQQL